MEFERSSAVKKCGFNLKYQIRFVVFSSKHIDFVASRNERVLFVYIN